MQFAFVEGDVVLLDGVLNRVMFGIKSLNKYAAGQFAPAGAASNLGHQLEGAFGGAEVRHSQRTVGADDSHERDAVKIVAFGEHLRADKNIQRAVRECAQRFLVLALVARGVACERGEAGVGKFLTQAIFELQRAFTKKINMLPLTLRT